MFDGVLNTTLDITSQRILKFDWPRAFLAIFKKQQFSQALGLHKKILTNFNFRSSSVKTNVKIYKCCEALLYDRFETFLALKRRIDLIYKNLALSVFRTFIFVQKTGKIL